MKDGWHGCFEIISTERNHQNPIKSKNHTHDNGVSHIGPLCGFDAFHIEPKEDNPVLGYRYAEFLS